MKFKDYLKEGFRHISSILNVYRSIARGVTPYEDDVWNALKDMEEYYEEYVKWNATYVTDPMNATQKKIGREYSQRLKEIRKSLKTRNAMLVTLDTAINQLHYDFPVLVHIHMSIHDLNWKSPEKYKKAERDYGELIDTLEMLLKGQGKKLPKTGYSGQKRPVRIIHK